MKKKILLPILSIAIMAVMVLSITLATGDVASTPTSCAQMEATTTVLAALTPKMVSKAVTKLKKDRVPKINGKYYAVIHPSVAEDLRNGGFRRALDIVLLLHVLDEGQGEHQPPHADDHDGKDLGHGAGIA